MKACAAALLAMTAMVASPVGPAWSEPAQGEAGLSGDLQGMEQTLLRNRQQLEELRDELGWAQELLQHAGETLQMARARHEQTLAVQRAMEQQFAALRSERMHARKPQTPAATGELTDAGQVLERYRAEIRKLRAEREQMRQALAARDQRLAQMQDELRSTRGALQRAEQDMALGRNDLEKVHMQYRSCQNRWADFSNKLERLNMTVSAAQQSLATTMHTRNLLQNRLSACNANLSRVRASFASMESAAEPRGVPESPPILQEAEPSAPAAEAAVPGDRVPATGEDTGAADDTAGCTETETGADTASGDCDSAADLSLEGLKFRYDSAELTDESRAILDRVAQALIRRPDVTREVAGHTDSQGDATYNLWLSRQRAEAVRNYLIARGVDGRRLVARGYGGSQPIADNSTWEGLVTNRRVELRVITPAPPAGIDTASLKTVL